MLRPRREDAHKGDFGHALLVCGSRGMAGAAVLAAMGALRSGCGLVRTATLRGIFPYCPQIWSGTQL